MDFYYKGSCLLCHKGFSFGLRELKVVMQMELVEVELVLVEMVQLERAQAQLVQVGVAVFEMSQVAIVVQRNFLHKEKHN